LETPISTAPQTATATPPLQTLADKAMWFVLEAVAIVFWLYALIKLFVFDVDNYLVARFLPTYQPFLYFKSLFLVGVIVVVLLAVKSKRLAWACVYIILYPLIVVLWKVPKFIFKQHSWVLAFAFANSLISFVQAFKINFVTAGALLIALGIVVASSSASLLWSAIAILLAALIVLYVRRFIIVFQPSLVFEAYLRFFPRFRTVSPQMFALDADMKSLPMDRLSPVQLEKWKTNLQTVVLYNRACLFVAKKLQDYQSSKLNFLSYIFSLIMLTGVTVAAFAGINMALFKLYRGFFLYSQEPTVFSFFYYSFNNLFHSPANIITPVLPISQGVFMLEVFFEFLLGALLVSLFFSVSNERYTNELKSVVVGLEREGKSMEAFVNGEYGISTIEDAIVALAKVKAGLINQIYWITKEME
jgi:hypothetical protein